MICGVNVIFKNNKMCVNSLLYVYIWKIRVYFVFINVLNFLFILVCYNVWLFKFSIFFCYEMFFLKYIVYNKIVFGNNIILN